MDPILPLPGIPTHERDLADLASQLRDFVGVHTGISSLPTPQIHKIPLTLRCVLREDYMTKLSEEFSRTSHEGDYAPAISTGLTLLALYLIVYPPNYPQIGKSTKSFLFLRTVTMAFRYASTGTVQNSMEHEVFRYGHT